MDDKINMRLSQYKKIGKFIFLNNNFDKLGNNDCKINESRLEYSLNLRKNKLLKILMQKRHNSRNIKNSELEINIDLLNLNLYKDNIEQFNNLDNIDEKYNFIVNSIINYNKIEIFQTDFLFFNNCKKNNETNDYIKFCLKNLYILLNAYSNNLKLIIEKKIFNKLLYELFITSELCVKHTILKILILYTNLSKEFNFFFIDDMRYIKNLYKLTLIENRDIVIEIFMIIYNIISDYPNQTEKIISNSPFQIRIKEFIISNKNFLYDNINYLIEILEILGKFIFAINADFYRNFKELILIFYEIIEKNLNEKINLMIYEILSKLSIDDNISKIIVSCGLGSIIYNQMKIISFQNNKLFFILQIMINLLSIEQISDYFIDNNIIKIISSILENCDNNEYKDNEKIIYLCIYCLSNIGASSLNQIHSLISSNILNLILKIIDYRKSNKIYYETCTLFYNIISKCSLEDFNYIIQNLKVMDFFYEGIYKSNKNEYVTICLKGIYMLIFRNDEFFFFSNIVKETLSNLTYNQNKEISNLSEQTIKLIDSKQKSFV